MRNQEFRALCVRTADAFFRSRDLLDNEQERSEATGLLLDEARAVRTDGAAPDPESDPRPALEAACAAIDRDLNNAIVLFYAAEELLRDLVSSGRWGRRIPAEVKYRLRGVTLHKRVGLLAPTTKEVEHVRFAIA